MNSTINRILVAEDHHVSRHLLERNLQNWGFDVITAQDGKAAAEILEGPDAPSHRHSRLDDAADGWGGSVPAGAPKPDSPYIYLLMLTAKSQKDEIAAGLDAGADDYVIKPFDPDELRARLKVGQRVVELERTLEKRVKDLEAALNDVKKLKGLLPICMYCKSVRDDRDYWRQIDEYIYTETGTDFSHGICPACMEKRFRGELM